MANKKGIKHYSKEFKLEVANYNQKWGINKSMEMYDVSKYSINKWTLEMLSNQINDSKTGKKKAIKNSFLNTNIEDLTMIQIQKMYDFCQDLVKQNVDLVEKK